MIQQLNELIQVGITSWGFGCGANTFPGVYARVSNQFTWIKKHVCDLSVNPPAEFQCDAPTLPPAQDVQVTIAVTFDGYPDEIALMIIDDTGYGVTLVEFPVGTFEDEEGNSIFYHTLTMKERSTYTFTITDSGGDGLCCNEEGSYVLYVGTEADQGEILVEGGGNFGHEKVHQLTVPEQGESKNDLSTTTPPSAPFVNTQENASSAPTQTPTMKPTAPPTVQLTPVPTIAPSSSPSVTPSSSPTESMAPSHIPTTLQQPKDKAQRNSVIFGVFIILIVAALFLVTSWYADRHTRMHKVHAVTPLVEAAKEMKENQKLPSKKNPSRKL
jgi:hypothetical protein